MRFMKFVFLYALIIISTSAVLSGFVRAVGTSNSVRICYKNSEATTCEETDDDYASSCDPDCIALGVAPFVYFQCASTTILFARNFNLYTQAVGSNEGNEGLMPPTQTPCFTVYICGNCDYDHDCSPELDLPLDSTAVVYPQAVDPGTMPCPAE